MSPRNDMAEIPVIDSEYVEPARVPVVDYQSLASPDNAKRRVAVQQLDAAFREYGFVYLSNHGIPKERVEQAFEWSRRFFELDARVKELIAHPPSGEIDDNRGWAKTGLGHTVQMVFDPDEADAFRQSNPDCKETLELGNPFSATVPPNKWLPENVLPGFRAFAESWWTDCEGLAHDLFRFLGEALQIDDRDYFSRIHSENDCHMTWNFYPSTPLQKPGLENAKRLNAHTDFGTLTIVFQDAVGGLEVHDGHIFRPIPPVSGAMVVNVGDMLEQLSNGRWKSALHRVVAPKQHQTPGSEGPRGEKSVKVIDRYSLVYFGVPNPDEVIGIVRGCEVPGTWKPIMDGEWGKLSAREWIQKRLAVDPESLSLAGKNAIVTGSSRGIGKQVVLELASRGANVAICFVSDLSRPAADKLAVEIRSKGVSATCVQEDLALNGSGQRLVEKALAGLKADTIHILVNNAALDPDSPTPVLQSPGHLFDRCMQVNAKAPLELVSAMVPNLPHAGGRIISISSVLARRPDVPFAAWASSKAALECLSRFWAQELATPHGLTSNVIAIGPTMTDYHAQDPPEVLEELSQLPSAAKRLGTIDDVAQIVAFLASDASRWINGDVIQGNGGMQFS
ncbi:hypothetical protein CABS01_11803 [Colletotrichum abscissum]|uniref:Fe2OG dioxygenase domain-containing protein n=1 Tax=Colletotrichum abscissum TaxID=1671311 RepID=A0A9P9XBX1_9PEZI|nr:uncharacterized protein CABS01_11803 [Colletotrichum abscissum]KAI3545141.1 hypothetical protein CABS02_09484 [Colletotrichum abscissum]KAK1492906.1 hypothetical protein CABS01_11803 [Colletotrichum abscissum]